MTRTIGRVTSAYVYSYIWVGHDREVKYRHDMGWGRLDLIYLRRDGSAFSNLQVRS